MSFSCSRLGHSSLEIRNNYSVSGQGGTGWEGRTARKGHLLKLLAKFSLQLCLSACKIFPKLLHFSEAQLRQLPLSPAPVEGRKGFGFELKGEVGSVIWVGGFKGK